MTISLSLKDRLLAAYDIVRGRAPRGMAVTSPFFYGTMNVGGGRKNSTVTAPRRRIEIEKLRRWSETSIPRRFINYYRSQISMLDWWLVPREGVTPTNADERRRRKVERLLEWPNADMNWNTFIEQVIEEMCVVGVAPIEIKTLSQREKSSINDDMSTAPNHMLYPFDGSSLQYVVDWDGSPNSTRYVQVTPDGQMIQFKNSELMPWKYVSRANTPHGLSPMETAYLDIERFLETGAYAARVASNVTPKKALFIKNLTVEQRNELLNWWRTEVEGSASIPIFGGEDAESIELGLVTDQNLFLGFQEFLITVIASAFGIDVMKANILVGINRSTGDTMSQTTDEGAVKPLADMIAQYINQYILPLYDLDDVYEFKFIYTSISDQKALSVVNQVELQDESITINEARLRTGRGPLLHPITKEDIGNVTVSMYRELLKIPEFRLKGWAGLQEALEREREQVKNNTTSVGTSVDDDFGKNSNNTNPDPSQRGGNGVYSAPRPKDRAYNQRDDSALGL